jgi:membrane-bound lytic murein transglycosylase D
MHCINLLTKNIRNMRRKVLFSIGIFSISCVCLPLSASINIDDSTYNNDIEEIQPVFEDNLDSLLNLYYMQQTSSINDESLSNISADDQAGSYQSIPDSVYISRLKAIPSAIPLTYNQIVRRYIEMYTQRKKDRIQKMLGMCNYYFPIFDDIFDYYGLPNELKYMSIIESALNPRARSRTRAVGIWQFMYGTGKLYGLTINGLIDERRDPIKSTYAAAQFSKDLYDIFNDWQLVIAAYNCGPGNVSRAIRRSGGKRNFWDIYPYLPRETRGHVPAFIAAVYTMNYYKEHNIIPVENNFPQKVDTVMINENMHLAQISNVLNIPIELLRDLNPQYIKDIIPGKGTPCAIILPAEYITKFIDQAAAISAYKDSIYFNPNEIVKEPTYSKYSSTKNKKQSYSQVSTPKGYISISYQVKQGDNLGFIADWFDCRVNDILDWNNLYSSRIKAGQRINIMVPQTKASYYKKINAMSLEEKQQLKNNNIKADSPSKTNSSSTNTPSSSNKSIEKTSFVYYTVKSGDTLWEIAQKYPGITLEDIREWNNLPKNAHIMPGQQIKIKVM